MAVIAEPSAVRESIPLVDLRPATDAVREAVVGRWAGILDSGGFGLGADVERFESAFAAFCGARHCIGTSSGLDALRLALQAAGVSPGERVAVPAMTFVATWAAVSQAGATPVPVDVSRADLCLDPRALASVAANVDAVVPVHLYGQLADMRTLRGLALQQGLIVVEDACQAHGAERDGVRPGQAAAAAAFSFYPGKNLGAFGDAGAIVTDDDELAATARSLRVHGQAERYHHARIGWTARLDALQAVVLDEKLPHLAGWNEARRAAAARYDEGLAGIDGLELPPLVGGSTHARHLYPVLTAEPLELAKHLAAAGIATGCHYPEPPHLSAAYRELGYGRGDFPVAEDLAARTLSLPLSPGLAASDAERVVTAVRAYFGA